MSAFSGPKISTDNLTVSLDGNNEKSTQLSKNLLPLEYWTIGTDSATFFGQNGDGNSRLLDINPFGKSEIVWQSLNNDVTSNADGGWNTSSFPIDNTKIYRFTTWVKRKVLGNGNFYLGTYGYNSANSNVGVLNRSNGAVTTNPYFTSFSWSLNVNEWYLVVGHIWPAGSGTGAVHPDTGIYTTAGVKVSTPQDFVWQLTNVNSAHRSYLYYSTDPVTNQQWYQPRVELCDGSEPIINELLTEAGKLWKDNSIYKNNCVWEVPPTWDRVGYYTFNGSTHYGATATGLTTGANNFTCEVWANNSGNGFLITPQSNGIDNWVSINASNWNISYTQSADVNNRSLTTSGTTAPIGIWTCCTFSIVSNTVYVWINGSYYGSQTEAFTIGNWGGVNWIFGQRGNSTNWFNGKISNVKIYNRKLSDQEVQQNFEALRGRYGI